VADKLPEFGWNSELSVKDWLFAEGYKFDFFQAVRLLELMNPHCPSVGEGSVPSEEAVQFQSNVSLEFPASDVQEIVPASANEAPAKMVVNFMGLAGAHGPLPHTDTELILERVRQRDTGLRDFLDIFNHRLISLMYRVAKVHRVALTSGSPDHSPISRFIYSFLGLGLPSLRNRMEMRDRALLYYAGLICQEPRSAMGLEQVLADYFQVKVSLRQFQGKWRQLEPDQWTSLGLTGQNQVLGRGAALGTRYWDQQGHFEVELGPMSFTQFLDFLPNGSAFQPLCSLTRFYAGIEFDFSLNLKILASEVPESKLGRTRLGWTSRLKTQPASEDDSQVHLSEDFVWKQEI
jgi:type VI secretion system protein ImpH